MSRPSSMRPVDRRAGRGDVERHAVCVRGERLQIGADLVGGVAARGDAVGADDAEIDIAMLHEMAAGVVGDQRERHAVLAEFEGGERGALIARPRLVDIDMHRHAAVMGEIDRRRRGAPIDGREPAGVAMGQHVDRASACARCAASISVKPASPMAQVELDVLLADFVGARERRLAARRRRQRRDDRAHVVERVAQVDGGRAAGVERAIGGVQRGVVAGLASARWRGHRRRWRRSAARRARPWS